MVFLPTILALDLDYNFVHIVLTCSYSPHFQTQHSDYQPSPTVIIGTVIRNIISMIGIRYLCSCTKVFQFYKAICTNMLCSTRNIWTKSIVGHFASDRVVSFSCFCFFHELINAVRHNQFLYSTFVWFSLQNQRLEISDAEIRQLQTELKSERKRVENLQSILAQSTMSDDE